MDLQFLHLVAQLAHADAEQAGGLGAVELGLLQGALDDVALDLLQVVRQVAGQCVYGRRFERRCRWRGPSRRATPA